MSITYGSVCSGIESASVAWEPLGMRPAWFAEIEKFPSAVLGHHWPQVPNLGDMTMIADLIKCGMIPAPELLVGGTPCQAFSVAGKRASLDDDRGQLTLEYVRILNAIDEQREEPAVCVWENVPGVLNTKDNAFGCFLGELAGSGCELQPPNGRKWGNAGLINGPQRTIAWRVLDAQFFGVAQRRRRVFVVASARAGFDPGQILLEFDSVRRDIEPSREAQQDAAVRTGEGFTLSSFGAYKPGCGTLRANGGDLGGGSETLTVHPITDKATRHAGKTGRGSGNGLGVGKPTDPSLTLTAGDKHAVCVHATQDPCTNSERAFALGASSMQAVCVSENNRAELRETDYSRALTTGGGKPGQGYPAARIGAIVRKLTPVECERLQGFLDNHTLIPWRGKPAAECPDGPRYKAIGNSKAVPVVRWVGQRILDHLGALGNTSDN